MNELVAGKAIIALRAALANKYPIDDSLPVISDAGLDHTSLDRLGTI
jgi:hypothetical protein